MFAQIPHALGLVLMVLSGIACVFGVLFFAMAVGAKPRQWRDTVTIWSFGSGAVVASGLFLIADPEQWTQALKTGILAGGGGLSFVVSMVFLFARSFRPLTTATTDSQSRKPAEATE